MKKYVSALAMALVLAVPVTSAIARELGDYDNHHKWHEADWWHKHHPDWMYEHHPEWAEHHSDWANEGDFDEHHHWHNRNWWASHHRDWVKEHHPDW